MFSFLFVELKVEDQLEGGKRRKRRKRRKKKKRRRSRCGFLIIREKSSRLTYDYCNHS